MKKHFLLVASSTLILAACGSGSSSGSSNTNPPSSDNYTPVFNVNTTGDGNIQTFGTSGSTANSYVATSTGVYSVPVTSGQLQSGLLGASISQISSTAATQISGYNGQLYFTSESQIYSYINSTQSSLVTIPSESGNLSALSQPSSNGTLFYGTSLGFVGALNNPAGKQINQITGSYAAGGILAIGCIATGSCNSGIQGIMSLTAVNPNQQISYFESSSASTWGAESYPTAFFYYNNVQGKGVWESAAYNNIESSALLGYYTSESNPGISTSATGNFAGEATVNEFVTSVTFNGGNIYVGTNLFNIYVAKSYSCNHGQYMQTQCPVTFTGPINTQPLGWLQTGLGTASNGSVGISYIAVQSSGQLYAIAQESATYAVGYVSNATSY